MKKICKCCGRNRKIGKFGIKLISPDGINPYCKDCMRNFTKNYKNSPKGKSIQLSCVLKYKNNNKEKIKDYNRQYYIKNKNKILYNKKCREETECVNIFDENFKKPIKKKINKSVEVYIEINPKRKI